MILNNNQLAIFLNITRQGIGKAIKENRLIKNNDNKLDMNNSINVQFALSHGKTVNELSQYVMSMSNRKINKPLKIKQSTLPTVKIKPVKAIKSKPIEVVKQVKKEKPVIKTMVIENQEELNDLDDETLSDETDYQKAYDITGLPRKLLNMNMKDLVLRHGNLKELDNLSKILPRLFMAQEKETKDNERKNLLVPKEFTESKLFLYLEILNNRILDYPENIIDKIIAYTLSDKTTARLKSIELMRSDLSVFIDDTKNKLTNEIERLTEKYQSESTND
jgi:hypothetical protein